MAARGVLAVALSLLALVPPVDAADSSASYAVVCDAGSTGTRAYVYSLAGGVGARVQAQRAAKVKPGLSTFGARPHESVEYLMELVADATPLVPAHLRSQTPLFVRATAGMRLIPEYQQQAVYDALFAGLRDRQAQGESGVGAVPFLIRREHFATLTGDEEGFFGLLAVNYLKGVIGADLMPDLGRPDLATALIHRKYMDGKPWIIGALDLGGSSTQISFSTQRGTPTDGSGRSRPLEPRDAYVHSYLGIGAELSRVMVQEHYASRAAAKRTDRIDFPCFFRGFESEVVHRSTGVIDGRISGSGPRITLVGSGNATECSTAIAAVVLGRPRATSGGGGLAHVGNPPICPSRPCGIGDVSQPPVGGLDFLAMSMHYYAVDCMRTLLPPSSAASAGLRDRWPQPCIDDISRAAVDWCQLTWSQLSAGQLGTHELTSPDKLPHRCYDANYVATLLGPSGFGIPTHEQRVTFSLEVDGAEVEWTLGAFLHSRLHSSATAAVDRLHAVSEPTSAVTMAADDMAESSNGDLIPGGWLSALLLVASGASLWQYSKRRRPVGTGAAKKMRAMPVP
jgi:hypothetical protein